MRKVIALALIMMAAVSCRVFLSSENGIIVHGCTEDGIDYSEEREVEFFDSFCSSGPFNVYYVQSDTLKVIVEGRKGTTDVLQSEVRNECLYLNLEKGEYRDLILRVIICAPQIYRMTTSGSGDLVIVGEVTHSGNLELRSSGSGDIISNGRLFINGDFSANTSGSGDVELTFVSCANFSSYSSGSGDFSVVNAAVSDDLRVRTSGSGSAEINGYCRMAVVRTSGSGDIYGMLNYDSIDSNSTGSGKIRL